MKQYQLKPIETTSKKRIETINNAEETRKTKQPQYEETRIQNKTFIQELQEELKVNKIEHFLNRAKLQLTALKNLIKNFFFCLILYKLSFRFFKFNI